MSLHCAAIRTGVPWKKVVMRRLFSLSLKIIFIYAIIGFALIPGGLHLAISRLAPAYLNQPLELGGVYFNPFTFELRFKAVKLDKPSQPVAGFRFFSVNLGWRNLLGDWHIQSVELDEPFADIIFDKSGTFNFANWIKASENQPD